MSHLGKDKTGHRIPLPAGGAIVLSWAARSDVGHRRQNNEDSVVVASPMFAVADGMGGHASGDRASAAAVEHLQPRKGIKFLDIETLEASLAAASADIDTLAEGIPVGVGTTVTGAALILINDAPVFAVFNIGDSRVYRMENNDLVQVTTDHSVVQELVAAGRLSPEEAENHPYGNVITRAVGPTDSVKPDYVRLDLVDGDRFVICSDGLTKELTDYGIQHFLGEHADPGDAVTAMMDAALENGGRDNVTLIVLNVSRQGGAGDLDDDTADSSPAAD